MTPEERLYQEARQAIENGQTRQARELLTRLLKMNGNNPDYWLWMSGVVETEKERGYCLREVLKRVPGHVLATRGLRLMGENLPDPGPALRLEDFKRDWKTSLEVKQPIQKTPRLVRTRIFAYSMLAVFLTGVIITGIVLALQPRHYQDTSPILRFTLTPIVTMTQDTTPQPSPSGPAPLWTLLKQTFTPTAIYVATPHNRTEAYQAAIRAYEKQDWARALEYFQQVLNDEPGSADVQYHIAEIYRQQGSYKNAILAYDAAIKSNPNFAPAYLGKGRALLETTPVKLADAESNLLTALDLDPLISETLLELANLALIRGESLAALGWLEKLDVSMQGYPLTELYRASAYLLGGENKKALTSIEKTNQMDPSLLPAYFVWGQVLQANDRFEDSIVPLTIYLDNAPADAEAELLMAKAMLESGKLDEAMVLIERVLAADKKSIDAIVIRGEIFLIREDFESANTDFYNALLLDRNSFSANLGMGRALLGQDMPGAGYEHLQTAAKNAVTDSEAATALYWQAVTLSFFNEVTAAIRDFEAFLAYPVGVVPAELREEGIEAYLRLVTPTLSSTPTRTPTRTPTTRISTTPTRTPTH